jgi:DNA helicase II / ATP-dependent DNA helicase PcrA
LHPILEGLTEAQREAVLHVEGPLLILAGPGSGKTRVVTHRIAWLLEQGVAGAEILALTFTNKAADEMRRRVERLVPRHGVWLGTFHRFCAGLLRRYGRLVGLEANYTIYDEDDAAEALRAAAGRLGAAFPKKDLGPVMQVIRRAKTQVVLPGRFRPRSADPVELLAAEAYPAYQRQLLRSNAADFDDLLLHVVRLLAENPEVRASLDERYRFILVDEYQDTNLAQYAIACRSTSRTWPSRATRISRSTAGAEPICATSWSSSATIPGCASCGSSRTTAARSAFCAWRRS